MPPSRGRAISAGRSSATTSLRSGRKTGSRLSAAHRAIWLFRRDLPRKAEVEAIYDEAYFGQAPSRPDAQNYLDYLGDEDSHRLTASRRLRWLGRRGVRPPGTVLDVGTAAGFFWDYIEHWIDPSGDVRAAGELLRTGGALALSTGDIGSLLARLSGRRWHLLTPRHHNFYFSVPTMRRLLERAGFTIDFMGHPSSPYSLSVLPAKAGHDASSGSRRRRGGRVAPRRPDAAREPLGRIDRACHQTLIRQSPPREQHGRRHRQPPAKLARAWRVPGRPWYGSCGRAYNRRSSSVRRAARSRSRPGTSRGSAGPFFT
jgi:hypothetical protein